MLSFVKKIITKKCLLWALVVIIVGVVFFRFGFLNHVKVNHIGVAYNSWNGNIKVQDVPGWYMTNPFTRVAKISTLPIKVTIPSDAKVIVSKIVRFKKEGVEEYIRLQGFHWFLSNSSLENILLGYAFSGKEFPFLEVIQEAGPENFAESKEGWKRASQRKVGGADAE